MAAAKRPEAPGRLGTPNLAALAAFVAVLEQGSFSRAAAALSVSQPSISFQVNALEKAVGVRLLRRRPRLELTDAGREVFARAKLILGQLDGLRDSVDSLRALRGGRLRIGFSSPSYAMPIIGRFMARHPGIAVETALGNTESLLRDVADCRVDVAIFTLEQPAAGMACSLIAMQELGLWLPRRHALAGRATITLAEALKLPLLTRETGSMTRQVFERACAARRLTPDYRLVLGNREALREAVAAGLGIAVVLEGEAGHDARLLTVPLGAPKLSAGLYLVHLPEMTELPAVQALLRVAAAG